MRVSHGRVKSDTHPPNILCRFGDLRRERVLRIGYCMIKSFTELGRMKPRLMSNEKLTSDCLLKLSNRTRNVARIKSNLTRRTVDTALFVNDQKVRDFPR